MTSGLVSDEIPSCSDWVVAPLEQIIKSNLGLILLLKPPSTIKDTDVSCCHETGFLQIPVGFVKCLARRPTWDQTALRCSPVLCSVCTAMVRVHELVQSCASRQTAWSLFILRSSSLSPILCSICTVYLTPGFKYVAVASPLSSEHNGAVSCRARLTSPFGCNLNGDKHPILSGKKRTVGRSITPSDPSSGPL